jgi:hypothetical protein
MGGGGGKGGNRTVAKLGEGREKQGFFVGNEQLFTVMWGKEKGAGC